MMNDDPLAAASDVPMYDFVVIGGAAPGLPPRAPPPDSA